MKQIFTRIKSQLFKKSQ